MRTIILLIMWCWSALARGASVELMLPAYNDDSHLYYHELIEQALVATGHDVVIRMPSTHLPQKRATAMLKSGQLSLLWLVGTQARDSDTDLLPIDIDLTNGLIGHRILLVPKGAEDAFRFVETLEDFRAMQYVGGFGKNWFDARVWEANKLPLIEVDGEWRRLYKMVATQKRGINYFSRGFTEVVNESLQHPYLSIEPYLVLVYQRDFRFYLPAGEVELAKILRSALAQAMESGLMDRLIEEFWREDFRLLNYKQRTQIHLVTPD